MTDKQLQDRNKQLCRDWIDWHDSELPKQEPVSDFISRLTAKYKLAETTIYQILKKNTHILLANRDWAKCKRIFRLEREIAQKEKSGKDVADLMEQLRKEYEGDGLKINGKELTELVRVVIVNGADIQNREKQQGSERVDLTSQARASFSEQG